MAELVTENKDVKKEPMNLYYVSFKQGYMQVFRTQMARGRKKKEVQNETNPKNLRFL